MNRIIMQTPQVELKKSFEGRGWRDSCHQVSDWGVYCPRESNWHKAYWVIDEI